MSRKRTTLDRLFTSLTGIPFRRNDDERFTMANATTMKELYDACKVWKEGDDVGFANVIKCYLSLTDRSPRVLADEFEAAISTVSRWASGFAKPRPRMQREIVGWIGKQAEMRLCT
jgi:hypothetical protein